MGLVNVNEQGSKESVLSEQKNQEWQPTNPDYDPAKPMQVGGQAVIEGVMMRAPGAVATAVRRKDGRIVVRKEGYRSVTERYRWMNVPVLRGAVGLVDMMVLGIRSLNFSAEVAMLDEDPADRTKEGRNGEPKKESSVALWLSLAVALIIGVGVFFAAPLWITTRLFTVDQSALAFNLITGAVRITILLMYLGAISFMRDVRRLFEYHGAEHKSVFAYELRSPLESGPVAGYSRFHPRCGTSFLLIVVVVAIVSFALVDALLIAILGRLSLAVRLAVHLPLIPVVGGAAYEVIKFSARHSTTTWGRLLIAPGLWLQRITTKEPDAPQIEVALAALRCALGQADASLYPLHAPEAALTKS